MIFFSKYNRKDGNRNYIQLLAEKVSQIFIYLTDTKINIIYSVGLISSICIVPLYSLANQSNNSHINTKNKPTTEFLISSIPRILYSI